MTRLLEQALEKVQALPPHAQDGLARIILELADNEQAVYCLTPEEAAAMDRADAAMANGDFATDDEVRAVRAKHGSLRLFSPA